MRNIELKARTNALDKARALPRSGTYREFEAVPDSQADDRSGFTSVHMLRNAFSIADSDLISVSYSDLLLALG